jgi:hypothetical protein
MRCRVAVFFVRERILPCLDDDDCLFVCLHDTNIVAYTVACLLQSSDAESYAFSADINQLLSLSKYGDDGHWWG